MVEDGAEPRRTHTSTGVESAPKISFFGGTQTPNGELYSRPCTIPPFRDDGDGEQAGSGRRSIASPERLEMAGDRSIGTRGTRQATGDAFGA